MKITGTLGLTAVMLMSTQTFAADEKAQSKDTSSALHGSYMLVAGEKDGQKMPDERVQGSTARITENTITTFDKDQKETYAMTYTLDKREKPWKITMTSTRAPVQGEVAQGLIEKDGDTVKLIYGVRGGAVPDDFTTEEKQLMFVMKKAS
jgi:uncharacterized protein (TIGR03067 family)